MPALPAYMYGPADEAAAILERQRQREEEFFERLENWRRWAKKRAWPSHFKVSQEGDGKRIRFVPRSGSVESAYRSPIWYTEDLNFQRWPTEQKSAWTVEQAWFSLPTQPVNYRACVKYAIVWGEPYRATCRRLKIHWNDYDKVLGKALSMLRNRLK